MTSIKKVRRCTITKMILQETIETLTEVVIKLATGPTIITKKNMKRRKERHNQYCSALTKPS